MTAETQADKKRTGWIEKMNRMIDVTGQYNFTN
jgi:hypothetical protein